MKKVSKNEEIRSILRANTVRKNKNGNYVARWVYFYKMGKTVETCRKLIEENLPNCIIIDSGDHFAAFRGGQSVAQGSHFYVEFKLE